MENKKYNLLVVFSCFFAFAVIALGAYTRLSDAGLGCPDWPGCYGFLTVPQTNLEVASAQSQFPGLEVEIGKAWKEMIHRYFAGTLGLIILAISVWSLMRRRVRIVPVKLPVLLSFLVLFQAVLGMLTVTMQLQPLIVMGHLLGGFSIFALLYLLYIRLTYSSIPGGDEGAKPYLSWAYIGLGLVVIQIALGGWLAANYSASHCIDLPLCGNETFSRYSFWQVFQLPHAAQTYEYGVLSADARMSIHFTHRLWGVVTAIGLVLIGIKLIKNCYSRVIKNAVYIVWLLLVCQVMLGLMVVFFEFPLLMALSHNLVAALLMLSVVRLVYLIKYKC